MIRKLGALLFITVLLGAGALFEVDRRWQQPLRLPAEGQILSVKAGESLRSVAQGLSSAGILTDPKLLILYARWTGADQKIKRGEYLLKPPLGQEELLSLLQLGQVVQYGITLPEGITVKQALELIGGNEALNHLLEGEDDPRLAEIILPYSNPEGLFFPDTYYFARGSSDIELLTRAHTRMIQVLEEEWQDRASELPFESPYEALIMASIIEKETGLAEERGEISGVFARRMQRGMRLQTDPTVIYGLGESFDGNLRRSDLRDDSNRYNTYQIRGLPPTPIALSGREAIRAAVNPEPGTTLYFVARGDGGHVFSDTLSEHQAAVRRYQLQRREDYRSSPDRS
ncbi:MAG: endolytic transglycosylase MltG [Pseudomonadota bacterium]